MKKIQMILKPVLIANLIVVPSCKPPVPLGSGEVTDCISPQSSYDSSQVSGVNGAQQTTGDSLASATNGDDTQQANGTGDGTVTANTNGDSAANENTTASNTSEEAATDTEQTFSLTGTAAIELTAENDQLWNSTISSVIKEKCHTCHGPATQVPSLESYEKIMPLISGMSTKVKDGSHPADKLTDIENTIFAGWMAFVTETIAASDAIDAEKTGSGFFEANLKAVIDAECVACHGGTEKKEPLLETYDQAKSKMTEIVNSVKKSQGTSGAMPPTKAISAESLKLFLEWQTVETTPKTTTASTPEELITPSASGNPSTGNQADSSAAGAETQQYAQSQDAVSGGSNPCK